MTWLTWPGTERRFPGHTRISIDPERGRFRWQFLPADVAFWTTSEAFDALKKGGAVQDAYRYLDASPPDSVFGVVRDLDAREGLGLVPDADTRAAEALVTQANQALRDGMSANLLLRAKDLAACGAHALQALRRNPNELGAQLTLADLAEKTGDVRAVFCEWMDVHFRVIAVVRSLRVLATPRAVAQRILTAYDRFDGLGELERIGRQLSIAPALDAGRWSAVVKLAKEWGEMKQWLAHDIEQLNQILPTLEGFSYVGPSGFDPLVRLAGKVPRTDTTHALLVGAVPALKRLLRSHDGRFRLKALGALVAIASPECVAVLRADASGIPDPSFQQEVRKGLEGIQRIVGERGAAWSR